MKLYTKINNDGKLPKDVSELIKKQLNNLSGYPVTIEIKKTTEIKLEQWGYLYGVVYPTAQKHFNDLGHNFSIEGVDAFFKMEFWNEEIPTFSEGEIIIVKIPKRKIQMNRAELSIYIENIKSFLNDYGCAIPEIGDGTIILDI
jgi:hypothetical protein